MCEIDREILGRRIGFTALGIAIGLVAVAITWGGTYCYAYLIARQP